MASERKLPPPAGFDPADAELTDDEVRDLKLGAEWYAEHGLAPPERKPLGRPKLDKPRVQLTLRLNQDTVAAFKASGDGWQRRMSDVLDAAARDLARATVQGEPLGAPEIAKKPNALEELEELEEAYAFGAFEVASVLGGLTKNSSVH